MWVVTIAVLVLAMFHLSLGLISVCVGVISSIRAEVWLAHSVSPIWSGGFANLMAINKNLRKQKASVYICGLYSFQFVITGILGFACARRKTTYLIMCFTAFNVVSVVTAIVSIQLLRLGLVNHTTDGHTFQKQRKDILIVLALYAAGCECLICIVSSIVSCRLAKAVKKEMAKKREETFHVQIVGHKDILVISRPIGAPPGEEKREKVLGVAL